MRARTSIALALTAAAFAACGGDDDDSSETTPVRTDIPDRAEREELAREALAAGRGICRDKIASLDRVALEKARPPQIAAISAALAEAAEALEGVAGDKKGNSIHRVRGLVQAMKDASPVFDRFAKDPANERTLQAAVFVQAQVKFRAEFARLDDCALPE